MSIQVTNLSKRQGNSWIFRDIHLSVADGEIFAVFGPISSAKCTLSSLIAGTERPNSGSVSVAGERLYLTSRPSAPLVSRIIGNVPHDQVIDKKRLVEAVRSRTIKAFVLDDPFRGLSSDDREDVGTALRTAASDGASVFFTTADFDDALEFSDRVGVLINGSLDPIGVPQGIYDEPPNIATAAMIGRSNLIVARRITSTRSETPEFMTIEGGHRLFARKTDGSALGALNQNVSLMIRPEQISISFGASFPEDNLLKAAVVSVTPMGATTRVKLDCSGLDLEVLVLRLVGLVPGDECMVGLPPDRIAVLRH